MTKIVESNNYRLFCIAKAEITCFLHIGDEFEEVGIGRLSLDIMLRRLDFFPVEICITSDSLWRNRTIKGCVYLRVCIQRERERERF